MADLATIDQWEVGRFADLVRKLGETEDANGERLLDNTLAFFSSEIEDGNSHRHSNLPVLLAGAGGGIHNPGRHIVLPDTPIANLYLSMLQGGGVDIDTFGSDGTSPLAELVV